MALDNLNTDKLVLQTLGGRLAQARLNVNVSLADMAAKAGISKRTLERVETGESVQVSSFIRVLQALDLLKDLDRAIPEPLPSPIQVLKMRGKQRKRASRATSAT